MTKQTRFFFDGEDQDTEDRLLPESKYREALNARISTSSRDGVGNLEIMYGNRLVAYTLPTGTNRVIGQAENERLNSVVYLVWNSNENHSILEFFRTTETIQPVLSPANGANTRFLNFKNTKNTRIYNAKIITKNINEDILYWTDNYKLEVDNPYDPSIIGFFPQPTRGYNPPRNLNLTLAKNYTQGLLPAYDNQLGIENMVVQNQYVDFALSPPTCPPEIVFADDTAVNTNFFRGKPLPQIRYRYVYYDGGRSVWSPISKVALPVGDENIDGLSFQNTFLNNRLDITINTGHPTVIQIELAVRFGNTNDWRRFEIIDKYTDLTQYPASLDPAYPPFTDVVISYYNDKVQQPLDAAEVALAFHTVPITAGSQEIIEKNVMTYGDIQEGYDNVNLDVALTVSRTTRQIFGDVSSLVYWQQDGAGNWRLFFTNSTPALFDYILLGSTVRITANLWTISGLITLPAIEYVVTQPDLVSPTVFITNLQAYITAQSFTWSGVTTPFVIVNFVGLFAFGGTSVSDTGIANPTVTVTTPAVKFKSLKNGAWHKFGIVYYDEKLRSGAVNTADNTRIYVPFIPELVQNGTLPNPSNYLPTFTNGLRITINHPAPKWATKYQIVYGRTNIDFYVQTVIDSIALNVDVVEININPLLNSFVSDNAPTPVNYVWQQGDRVRFITTSTATGYQIIPQYIDLEIKSLSTSAPFLLITEQFDFTTVNIGEGTLIEIYRTNQDGQIDIYEEIGECYDIVYNQAVNEYLHQGNVQNQFIFPPFVNSPAIIDLDFGNTYVKPRRYDLNTQPDWTNALESDPFSDFYPSGDYDYGRANADVKNITRQNLESYIRFGGQFFQNTGFNGIADFRPNDIVALSIRYGRITGLREIGYVLKAVQEQKITSIYVGRTELFNTNNTTNLAASTSVLGTLNPSEEDYGSRFSGSIVANDRHLYFFDSAHGAYVRDSANGMVAISKYGQVNKFKRLGVICENNLDKIEIVSDFNKDLEVLFTTFRNLDPEFDFPDRTYGFYDSDQENKWAGNYNFTPEFYAKRGLTFLHFLQGQVYIMDENAPLANYFGTQFPAHVKTVFNMDAGKKKVFKTIKVDSNRKWRCTNTDGTEFYITIPEDQQYPQGMKSRLQEAKFKPKEGFYWAELLNDANSPNFATEEQALINGRRLRGSVLIVKLEITPTQYTKLFSVTVEGLLSELS